MPESLPFTPHQCHRDDAPTAHLQGLTLHTGRLAWTEGLPGQPLAKLPGYDTGVIGMLLALLMVFAVNMRHSTIYLKTFARNLLTVRRRSNVFDKNTLNETRIQVSLTLLLCMCEGVLMYALCRYLGVNPTHGVFAAIGSLTLLAIAYYVMQLGAYRLVGFVFTSPYKAVQWVQGFNASQSLLGLCLMLPMLVVLFNPSQTYPMLIVSVLLYIAARIIFICKGFRIFYHKSLSLLYFILYLCALEIIPLRIMYRMCMTITSFE